MKTAAFSNPPWYDGDRIGCRAGSRWPFTFQGQSKPDNPVWGDYTPFPFFLAFAAAYLAKHDDVNVSFRDSIARRDSYPTFFRWLELVNPDYVVIESATPSWPHDRRLIEGIRFHHPAVKVIVTGPIATVYDPAWNVHACIKGEYEKGVERVVCGGESGLIDFDLMTEAEMSAAPFMVIEPETVGYYFDSTPQGQRYPHLQAWSSRGCPYRCSFCVWPAAMTGNDPDGNGKRSIRHYSHDYMLAVLTEAVAKHGFRSIYFDDDTFNINQQHVKDMCQVMRHVNLPWSAMCRADGVDRETWREMYFSGCFGVKLGFESGNQWVLDNIVNKRLNLEEALETLAFLSDLGMTTHGTFTTGLPGETDDQRADTLAYIERCYNRGMTTHQLSGTAAIEGTPLATLLQVGRLDRYPGATAEGFMNEADGQKKIEGLACR